MEVKIYDIFGGGFEPRHRPGAGGQRVAFGCAHGPIVPGPSPLEPDPPCPPGSLAV